MNRGVVISALIVVLGYLVWTHEKEFHVKKNKIGILMVNRRDVQWVCKIADSFKYVYRVIVIEDNSELDQETCIHSSADKLDDCDTIMVMRPETDVTRSLQMLRNHQDPGNLLDRQAPRPPLRENLDWRSLNQMGEVLDVVQWVTCL